MALAAEHSFSEQVDRAREFFEPRLRDLGLAADQIQEQSLEDLHRSLEQVNDAIAHPELFGVLKLQMSPVGLVIATAEAHIEVGVLPILLERKKLVLERIAALSGGQEYVEEADRIEVQREEVQQREADAIAEFETEYGATMLDDEKERKLKRKERKMGMWRLWFERESVATIIGGLLLIAFAVALIVAMFKGVEATEVVTNSFLLILGYFFGQSTGRRAAE